VLFTWVWSPPPPQRQRPLQLLQLRLRLPPRRRCSLAVSPPAGWGGRHEGLRRMGGSGWMGWIGRCGSVGAALSLVRPQLQAPAQPRECSSCRAVLRLASARSRVHKPTSRWVTCGCSRRLQSLCLVQLRLHSRTRAVEAVGCSSDVRGTAPPGVTSCVLLWRPSDMWGEP